MITREQLDDYLGEDPKHDIQALKGDYDHTVKVITLLRERIPYGSKRSIISGSGHEKIFLTDIDTTLRWLEESDLVTLAECNVFIDEEYEYIGLFV